MEITRLKREYLLKMGLKASRSKFVAITVYDDKEKNDPVLNKTYGHPLLVNVMLNMVI